MIFTKTKKLFKIDGIDVNKILVSKKEPYGIKNSLKYSIGYNDDGVIRPLCIKVPQMMCYGCVNGCVNGCVKHFDSSKKMCLKLMIIDC